MHHRNPLTIEIAGGLGNQLFMFYAGLLFKEKMQKDIIFDVTDLTRIAKLHPGNNIQTLGLLNGFSTITRTSNRLNNISRVISRLERIGIQRKKNNTFVSQEIGFINSDLVPLNTRKIRGYFQSWKYYDSLDKKPILTLNNIKNPSDWLNKNLAISKKEKILSLHLRRGDYALPENRANGILSRNYYEAVLNQVGAYDRIWVFTDSPKEVEMEFSSRGYSFESSFATT
jgi:hypothetical protein